MAQPLITVIIPTYRPQDYVARCIESVAQQTLPQEQYEVVVVLNGSDESHLALLRGIAQRCAPCPLTLITTAERGVSAARNLALQRARGEYITFVDDDDWLSNNYLASLLALATTDSIVQANLRMLDEQSGSEIPHYVARAFVRCREKAPLSVVAGRSFLSSACCKLLPRAIIGDTRFDTALTHSEDALFMFTLSKKIRYIGLSSPDTIYYVQRRQASASRQPLSLARRWQIATALLCRFTAVYLRDMRHYSLPLLLTRLAATVRRYLLSSC